MSERAKAARAEPEADPDDEPVIQVKLHVGGSFTGSVPHVYVSFAYGSTMDAEVQPVYDDYTCDRRVRMPRGAARATLTSPTCASVCRVRLVHRVHAAPRRRVQLFGLPGLRCARLSPHVCSRLRSLPSIPSLTVFAFLLLQQEAAARSAAALRRSVGSPAQRQQRAQQQRAWQQRAWQQRARQQRARQAV